MFKTHYTEFYCGPTKTCNSYFKYIKLFGRNKLTALEIRNQETDVAPTPPLCDVFFKLETWLRSIHALCKFP